MRALLYIVLITVTLFAVIVFITKPTIKIIDKPIKFGPERIAYTKEYIQQHYDKNLSSIAIEPQMIVLHWTGDSNASRSFGYFYNQEVPSDWGVVSKASRLNVSAHFLVDRDGTIYRMMPETQMARHVIGLNLYAIGIENVGGDDQQGNLTPAQLSANIYLVQYLKNTYPKIRYLIPHRDYTLFEQSALWLEKDSNYKTLKYDVDEAFFNKVFEQTKVLGLQRTP